MTTASTRYQLAAIDIDDTLLGPDARISDANAHAVATLRARGVQIVLASGRSHDNMLPYHHALGLPRGPVVSSQGAVVRDSDDGAIWSARVFDATTVRALTLRGRARGFTVSHYGLHSVFVDQESEWQAYDQSRNEQRQSIVDDLLADGNGHDLTQVVKVIWLGEPTAVAAVVAEARAEFGGLAMVIPTDPPYLEFTSPGTSKAAGLIAIADRLQIDPSAIMAFGDGHNDVEMLSWAGLGIAMSHARESAKQAARFTAPDGDHASSLARAITLALS